MKKTIISLSLATIALFSASSMMAQDVKTDNGKKTEKRGEGKMNRSQAVNPFEGLNLTDQQETAIQSLNEEQQTALKQNKEEKKADKQKRGEEMKEAMKAKRQDYLGKLKGILTPDQYIQFLENNFLNQKGMVQMNRKAMDKSPRGDKKGKDGQKHGNRPERKK